MEQGGGDALRAEPDLGAHLILMAHALVQQGWCKGALALDEDGKPVDPAHHSARRWSASGALDVAWRDLTKLGHDPEALRSGFERADLALGAEMGETIAGWNDAPGRSQGEVLEAFEKALARAQRLAQRGESNGGAAIVPPPPAIVTAFNERRRELEELLSDYDYKLWNRRPETQGPGHVARTDSRQLMPLANRLELDLEALPPRRSAKILTEIMFQAAGARLRILAALADQMSAEERNSFTELLRLPQAKRRAFAMLLRLPETERHELATVFSLADAECHGLAAFVRATERSE
jgi:hypothetical protein